MLICFALLSQRRTLSRSGLLLRPARLFCCALTHVEHINHDLQQYMVYLWMFTLS